jgi:hypothetical protein
MRKANVLFSPPARRSGRLGRDYYSDLTGFGRIENALARNFDTRENIIENHSLLAIVIFYDGSAFFKDKTLSTRAPINDTLTNGIGGCVLAELINEAIEKNMTHM